MLQTVKFGKVRAKQDPDRTESTPGIYYGINLILRRMSNWNMSTHARHTHGVCVRQITR